MAQGLRHRSAVRRPGIGLVLLGAAVGCHGTDKPTGSSLPPVPPPKLAATQPGPAGAHANRPAVQTSHQPGARGTGADPATAALHAQFPAVGSPPPPANP